MLFISNTATIETFHSLEKAEKKGFRVCKHCFGLYPFLKNEGKEFESLCKKHGIFYRNNYSYIDINTVYSRWKIYYNDLKNKIELYHINSYENGKKSVFEGYHLQNIDYDNLCDLIAYIADHDEFRHKNPVYIKQGKPKKAHKGTRAYKNLQKAQKNKQRRRAIYNVLCLIDSLQTQAQPA